MDRRCVVSEVDLVHSYSDHFRLLVLRSSRARTYSTYELRALNSRIGIDDINSTNSPHWLLMSALFIHVGLGGRIG